MAEHEEQYPDRNSRWGLDLVVTIIRVIGNLIALILVAHIVLTIFGANPDSGITQFVTSMANPLALGFRDLFVPSDEKLRVLANYGIAAIFWLIVTSIVIRIIRRSA